MMKNKLNHILIIFVFFFLITGCGKKQESRTSLQGIDFGESVYYEPFLWEKSDTTILTKKIQFEFSDFAVEQETLLELQFTNYDGINIDNDLIAIYVEGKLIGDGIIKVYADTTIVTKKIGLQLLPTMKAGDYHGYVVVVKHNLDRIDDFERNQINEDNRIKQWSAYYEKDWNPLATCLFWLLIIIAGILLLWFFILRNQFYPKMKRGKIQVLSPYFGGVIIKSNTKLIIFTHTKQKQSWLNKVFTGNIIYDVNSIYKNDITFKKGRGSKIKIKLPIGSRITPPVMNLAKHSSYKIKLSNQTIQIQYL